MVATPIGNLGDITLRALETLKEVDLIACEDTRHTQKLLTHYDIHKRLIATHAHNELASAQGIIQMLSEGLNIAFVSDAGTPGISDPGSRLVQEVRQAGFPIIPIPGPSALSALVSVAALSKKSFFFEGFLSPKASRRKQRLAALLATKEAFVVYESPFRILKLLKDLEELESSRRLLMGREMTKMHQEYVEGSAATLLQLLGQRESVKGEFSLLIYPPDAEKEDDNYS